MLPVDPLLIIFCVKRRERAWWYATVATIASVIGGLFGYCLGYWLWDLVGPLLVSTVMTPALFERAVAYYTEYEALAVLIGGFTPVPYKAITLSAGFCHLSLIPFVSYSIVARGARFFLVAGIVYRWGEHIAYFIDQYFSALVYFFSTLFFLGFFLFYW